MEPKDQLIEIRNKTGLNRKEFAEAFGIPYRTITDWELGNRVMPDYVLRLISYRVAMDRHNISLNDFFLIFLKG